MASAVGDGVAEFVSDDGPVDAVSDDEVDGAAVEAEAPEEAEWCAEEQPASAAAARIATVVTRFMRLFGRVRLRVRARAFMALTPQVGVRYRRS